MKPAGKPLYTAYAPAERTERPQLEIQRKKLLKNDLLQQMGDALSTMIVVLNKDRQILYANKAFLNLLGLDSDKVLIGLRPGEAVHCIHACENDGGCGTTEFCSVCGAVNTILEAQDGVQSENECRINTAGSKALDLRVKSTPLTFGEQNFTFFAVMDISHEKRRLILERVFFHDILNSMGGINGLTSIMPMLDTKEELIETANIINKASQYLIEEIKAQRIISLAERGDLQPHITRIQVSDIINEVMELYEQYDSISHGKTLQTDNCPNFVIYTDGILLKRILGNMVKNALEASHPGDVITLYCEKIIDRIRFSVHNPGHIPGKVKLQIFNRSFSTKGNGRGIGTFSMKMLGEKYLKGKVWFSSTPGTGTRFYVELPINSESTN